MLCCKRQGNYVVCNELPSDTVGWVVPRGTVGFGSFAVRIRKVLSLFPFFLRGVGWGGTWVGLVLGSVLGLGLGLWLALGFKPSSPIVREGKHQITSA